MKNITFHFLSNLFWWLEKWATVIAQNYFGKFCYCVPGWKISKHGFLEPLGGPLAPCDSLLLWTRLFIQIRSETLCRLTQFAATAKDHPIRTLSLLDLPGYTLSFSYLNSLVCSKCYTTQSWAVVIVGIIRKIFVPNGIWVYLINILQYKYHQYHGLVDKSSWLVIY